jgi:oligopeptidase B
MQVMSNSSQSALAAPIAAPVAAKKPASITHHGITVTDDYAWLRDAGYPQVTDKAVLAHLEAENAWFEARMAPRKTLVDDLFKEMRARIKEADRSVPQKDGDYLYWIEFEEGAEYKKWWRKPVAGGEDELILDEVALAAGHEYFRLGALSVSNDGKMLAWSVDDNGSERFTARIKVIATARNCPM